MGATMVYGLPVAGITPLKRCVGFRASSKISLGRSRRPNTVVFPSVVTTVVLYAR